MAVSYARLGNVQSTGASAGSGQTIVFQLQQQQPQPTYQLQQQQPAYVVQQPQQQSAYKLQVQQPTYVVQQQPQQPTYVVQQKQQRQSFLVQQPQQSYLLQQQQQLVQQREIVQPVIELAQPPVLQSQVFRPKQQQQKQQQQQQRKTGFKQMLQQLTQPRQEQVQLVGQQQRQPKIISRQQLDELLTCKVCRNRYNAEAEGARLPRQLDCSHVFCQQCLLDCGAGERLVGGIKCRICKGRTALGENKVMGLPVNKSLLGLLKKTEKRENGCGVTTEISGVEMVEGRERGAVGGVGGPGAGKAGSIVSFKSTADDQVATSSPGSTTDQSQEVLVIRDMSRLHPSPNRQQGGEEQGGVENEIFVQNFIPDSSVSQKYREIEVGPQDYLQHIAYDRHEGAGAVDDSQVSYPLNDLHDLAPRHLRHDLDLQHDQYSSSDVISYNEREGGTPQVGGSLPDFSSLMADLQLVEPPSTTATYVGSFGKYSQVRTAPGAFCSPSRISCSPEHKLVIVDTFNETVQAFSTNGECLAIFDVLDVTAACFLTESLLAVASSRGVELYGINGVLVKSITVGPTLSVARLNDGGFVAAHTHHISVAHNPTGAVKIHTISGTKKVGDPLTTRSSGILGDISDVAISSDGQLVILDGWTIHVMTPEGRLLSSIDLGDRGAAGLNIADKPYALAVDPVTNRVAVSTRRVITLHSLDDTSRSRRCLVNLDDQVVNEAISAHGVAINGVNQLFIILRAPNIAETAIFNI